MCSSSKAFVLNLTDPFVDFVEADLQHATDRVNMLVQVDRIFSTMGMPALVGGGPLHIGVTPLHMGGTLTLARGAPTHLAVALGILGGVSSSLTDIASFRMLDMIQHFINLCL